MARNFIPQRLVNEAVGLYGNRYLFVYPNRSLHDDFDWILGDYKKEGHTGICSHCGSHIEYNGRFYVQRGYGALDKDYSTCPECYSTLEVKKGWYGKKKLKQRFYLQAIDVPEREKVIIYEAIIFLDGWDNYRDNYGPDDVTIYDLRSTVLTPRKSVTTRWNGHELKNASICGNYEACGYPLSGFNQCITNTGYVIGAEKLSKSYLAPVAAKLNIDETLSVGDEKLDLLIRFNEEPMTELLYTMGFSCMASDRTFTPAHSKSRYMNFKADSPKNFLRGMNDKQKMVVRSWLSRTGNKGEFSVRETEKIIRLVKEHDGVTASALDFKDFKNEKKTVMDYIKAVELISSFSPVKISNYIKRHCEDGRTGIYLDYLRMALKLNPEAMDEEIAFPKNLTAAHDKYAERISYAENAEQTAKMKERLSKKLNVFDGYSWGGLIALMPENPQQIISEGQQMKNCIGNYADDHANELTTIVFIRRATEPDRPFFDLELNLEGESFTDIVEQCYGYNNRSNAMIPECSDRSRGIPENEKKDSDIYVHEFLLHYVKHIEWCRKNEKLSQEINKRSKTA